MRQDQYERLQQLEEKLTDVFIGEAEPDKWPGHGIDPGAMTQQTRGDRYWVKRNAVATLSLMQRVGSLIGQVQLRGAGTTPPAPGADGEKEPPDQLEADVAAAEKEAAQLLKELTTGAGKARFDRKMHGSKAG